MKRITLSSILLVLLLTGCMHTRILEDETSFYRFNEKAAGRSATIVFKDGRQEDGALNVFLSTDDVSWYTGTGQVSEPLAGVERITLTSRRGGVAEDIGVGIVTGAIFGATMYQAGDGYLSGSTGHWFRWHILPYKARDKAILAGTVAGTVFSALGIAAGTHQINDQTYLVRPRYPVPEIARTAPSSKR